MDVPDVEDVADGQGATDMLGMRMF
jgi:hypothetical protein